MKAAPVAIFVFDELVDAIHKELPEFHRSHLHNATVVYLDGLKTPPKSKRHALLGILVTLENMLRSGYLKEQAIRH